VFLLVEKQFYPAREHCQGGREHEAERISAPSSTSTKLLSRKPMNDSSLRFRELERRDIATCIKIRASTNENRFSIDALTQAGVTEESVAGMLDTTHKGWVGEVDGQVVGFGMGNRSNGEFWVVAVLPEYEGRGIGKKLTELTQEWLFARGCAELWCGHRRILPPERMAFTRNLAGKTVAFRTDNGS
jgi:ribosomal protein S18 acetylase RimI-like enzyme